MPTFTSQILREGAQASFFLRTASYGEKRSTDFHRLPIFSQTPTPQLPGRPHLSRGLTQTQKGKRAGLRIRMRPKDTTSQRRTVPSQWDAVAQSECDSLVWFLCPETNLGLRGEVQNGANNAFLLFHLWIYFSQFGSQKLLTINGEYVFWGYWLF